MYAHRPDILSFAFGLLFTAVGLAALLGLLMPDAGVVISLLAMTAGVGVAGSLLSGDVHRRAAERLARRQATRSPAPAPVADPTIAQEPLPLLDDPMFGPPIDPEELDRAYRETFGEQGPDLTKPSDSPAP